jgi:transcriptional regulator with XRE-family HTH domain
MVSLHTLSDRLVFALKERNVSQSELAQQIGISQQAIQYLCKGKLNHSKFTFEIAASLNISIVWLATGKGTMSPDENPYNQSITSQNKIPILSFEQIIEYYVKKTLADLSSIDNYVLPDTALEKSCFAFKLQDNSMYPKFDQNTIAIADHDKKPEHLSFVVAYLQKIDAIIVRQLHLINDRMILKPANNTIFNCIELADASQIIGTLVKAKWEISL